MRKSNIGRLKELTHTLKAVPTLDALVATHISSRVVYHGDKISGFTLLYIVDVIHVGKFTADDGAIMEEHQHKELELGIMTKGCFRVTYRGKVFDVGPGERVIFDPNEAHKGVFIGESEMIFLTTPPTPGYPKVDFDEGGDTHEK